MAKASGTFESITLAGRRFVCDAECEPEVDLTGYANEAAVNGDGSFRIVKTRKINCIEGIEIQVDVNLGDLDFIKDLQNSSEVFAFTATRVDGNIYSGEVIFTGDVKFKEKTSTMEVAVSGKIEVM